MNSNTAEESVRLVVIGAGSMGRHHLRKIFEHFPQTHIPVVCEPSPLAFKEVQELCETAGRAHPVNEPDLNILLDTYSSQLDAAFIITPHALHHDQTIACLERGLDVLLEKPMVMNPLEARNLIRARDSSHRLLVVAFNGSLSPEIREASRILKAGELGDISSISGTIWQDWRQLTDGTWRQDFPLSGGGFLFDTGAHLLNTVSDLAGHNFNEVASWFDRRGTQVEINVAAIGNLASGALVSLHGSGDTIQSCDSEILVFCSQGILRTGAWGGFLEIRHPGDPEFTKVETRPSTGAWEQFLAIRRGGLENPTPPEVGLRFAYLYDALRKSAEHGGKVIQLRN